MELQLMAKVVRKIAQVFFHFMSVKRTRNQLYAILSVEMGFEKKLKSVMMETMLLKMAANQIVWDLKKISSVRVRKTRMR
jgi:hypothetical protein